MPKLDLTRARRIKTAAGEVTRLKGAGFSWTNPIVALYGTGLGKIPLHLRPEDAVLDGGGNVVSVPNRGGAGAYADSIAVGTIARTGGLLGVNASYLALANPLDLIGVHAFLVVRATISGGNHGVLGRNAGGAAGERTHFQWQSSNSRFVADRWNGTTYPSSGFMAATLSANLALVELAMTPSAAVMTLDGVSISPASHTLPDFRIDRIGAGRTMASFVGQIGDVVSLISDGSPAMAAPIATIRQALASKYGIALG